jgi:hypothetical protein
MAATSLLLLRMLGVALARACRSNSAINAARVGAGRRARGGTGMSNLAKRR